MDARTLRVLEYPALLNVLAGHAASSLGRELALAMKPFTERRDVTKALAETAECRALLDLPSGLPMGGVHDIRTFIERAAVSGALDPKDLLTVAATLSAAKRLRGILMNKADQAPLMADLGSQMGDYSALVSKIERSITPDGLVADGASENLARIRNSMRRQVRHIQDVLQQLVSSSRVRDMLTDPVITVRNGRYCLPVKPESKNAFGGLIHDSSASGQTLFMEPQAVVEAGNELRELESRERDEVDRILRAFSEIIAKEQRTIRATVTALAHLDLVIAKARMANTLHAESPTLLPAASLDLMEARHPLLVWQALEAQRNAPRNSDVPAMEDAVVPIDLWLGKDFNTMIITGPNTGGKTVTLKTAALFVLMAQSGMPVPARKASIGIFRNVYADIGDEQSLQQSLSTFSGHIRNIVAVLKGAGKDSLVVLDELGAGTDPAEGAALAKAILLSLAERGALTIATTHYAELKEFAWNNAGFHNASVEFNVETLKPTYRLRIGVPGASNALVIAGRLGIPPAVIDTARANLGTDRLALEDAIGRLEEAERKARWAAVEAEKEAARLEAQRRDAEKELSEAKDKRRAATEAAYDEATELLREAREQTNVILKALRDAQLDGKATEEARKTLQELDERVRAKRPKQKRKPTHRISSDESPIEGDSVWIPGIGATGQLVDIQKDQATVQAGTLRMVVPYSTLQKVEEEMVEKPKPKPQLGNIGLETAVNVSTEIHLRGERVDEALQSLERYLDDARVAGLHTIRIVHGKGTGALRDLVHRYLKEQRDVKGFRLGQDGEGGHGVTIAELA
ncbi:MAG TPA: endonuclease MutS2 [Armatimonadota bacterium]|jgi:DNA mismatch repair protein MutS2